MDQHDHGFDPVLPSQFFRHRPDTPERRLLAAVLEDAVRTYQHLSTAGTFRGRRLFREVDAWFASERGDYPFAFVPICEVLGLDCEWIRGGLARWRARDRAHDPVVLSGRPLPTATARMTAS